jgi:hypothetical protein
MHTPPIKSTYPIQSGSPILVSASRSSLAGVPRAQCDPVASAWSIAALTLAAAVLVFADTWRAMAATWASSETLLHGMAVAPIAVWLVWRRRQRLAELRSEPDPLGLLAVGAVAAVGSGADLTGVDVAAQSAAVAVLPAIVWAIAGRAVASELAFPLGFLFFMVPLVHEGLHVTLPSGLGSVVEACSGRHALLTAAMLSTLFVHLNRARTHAWPALLATALGLALAASWLSADTAVMAGPVSDVRLAVGDDHAVHGWVSFGVLLASVAAMGLRWRDAPVSHRRPGRQSIRLRIGSPPPVIGPVAAAVLCVSMAIGARAATTQLGDVRWDTDFEARAAAAPRDHRPGLSWYTADGLPTSRAEVAWLRAASRLVRGRGDHATVATAGTAVDGTRPGDPIQTGGIERARARLESIALPLATLSRQVTGP